MKRKSFDKIVTAVGFGLAVFLLIAAGLLNWGANFASSAVSSQLEAQEITFPAVTGNEDESAKAGMVETVFKGTMLRGTLLTAYAFGTLGSIAAISALVSLAGAAVMLLLSILGLLHIRCVPEDATI
jgi:hypothetical protein